MLIRAGASNREMIGALGEMFRLPGSGVERAAVVSDARGGEYFEQLSQVLDDLGGDGIRVNAIGPGPVATEALRERLVRREAEGGLPVDEARIFAEDGTLIGEFYVERRYVIPLSRIPGHVRLAFLAAEDADFYRHRGVDPVSIGRAFYTNLVKHSVVQGGSTITQQVVKNILLDPERTYRRKFKEVLLARRMEQDHTKDEILELYLNHIFFGANFYGVQSAAKGYFGKDVKDLSIEESATICGLIKSPNNIQPIKHPQRALKERNYVLERMAIEGTLTPEDAEKIKLKPLMSEYKPVPDKLVSFGMTSITIFCVPGTMFGRIRSWKPTSTGEPPASATDSCRPPAWPCSDLASA